MARRYIVIKNSKTGSTSVALPGDKRINSGMWSEVSKHTSRDAAMKAMAKADPVKAKVDALLKRKRQDRSASASPAPKRESAADRARRVSGAKNLGVLEDELEREQKGRIHGADLRVPGADVNKRKGIGGAAHKDIKATTSAEKRAAGDAMGLITGIPLIKDVAKGISTLPDIVNRKVRNKKIRQDEADQKMNPRTPGSTTGKKEKYMAEVDAKEAEKQKREAEKQKRLARRRDLQKRLQGEVPPSVGDRQGPGMDAITPPPRPAAPKPAPKSRPVRDRQGSGMDAIAPRIASPRPTAPKPPVPKMKPPVPGSLKKPSKPPSGRRNVPDTEEFVGLKEANRNRVIKDAVADLKKKKYIEEFTGEKEWRDPDKITTKAQRIDPSLKQKRRGQYSANKRDEDEWERMREENQGARKGGKITKKKATRKQAAPKKSSTSRRSRPKNPTLQKTSYNY